jgi:acetate kinase
VKILVAPIRDHREAVQRILDCFTNAMEEFASLFPAHNSPYLSCISYFQGKAPGIPLVGVFEPGFHGASFRYVTGEVVRRLGLGPANSRIIACHLGGSSSMCAFKNGRSIDTSFSFTTQSGLPQTARMGDVDPYVFPSIMEKKGISPQEAFDEREKIGEGTHVRAVISLEKFSVRVRAKKG